MKPIYFRFIAVTSLCLCSLLGSNILSSCQREVESIEAAHERQDERAARLNAVDSSIIGSFEVRDGILHFKDLASYLAELENIKKIPLPERYLTFKAPGFKSLLSSYQELFDLLNSVKEREESVKIIEKFNSIASQTKDGIVLLNSDHVSSALLDERGLIYIGKILHRFTDKGQTIVLDGDIKKLNTSSELVKNYKSLYKIDINKGGRLANALSCPGFTKYSFNADSERQIKLEVYCRRGVYPNGNQTATTTFQPFALGTPYRAYYKSGYRYYEQYRTTNFIGVNWVCQVETAGAIQSARNTYAYDNDWNFIDYGGSTFTFNNVPYDPYYGPDTAYINFFFDGGYYYSRGVPEQFQIGMSCP